jgi:hypothetical protein
MLYIVGGAARAGKSAVARRFLAETGVPYFPLDCLMMGFAKGFPEHGVGPEDDELHVAELLWPVVKGIATTFVEEEIDYLIEGAQLHPRHVGELCEALPGDVRACFLGFAEVDTMTKLRQIRRFGGGEDDWLRHYDDQHVIREIERLKALSERLRAECSSYEIRYLEVSTDLEETVDRVVQYLKGSVRAESRCDDRDQTDGRRLSALGVSA